MKYIDADKIKAEIERHIKHYEKLDHDEFKNGELYICKELLFFIDSLQQDQLDVDLNEDIQMVVPKNIHEALDVLDKILSDEDKEYLLKNGAISMHNSLGRWIRNEWGLWTGSELKDELMNKGLNHPDDMSNYILEKYIEFKNNTTN